MVTGPAFVCTEGADSGAGAATTGGGGDDVSISRARRDQRASPCSKWDALLLVLASGLHDRMTASP